MKKRNSTINYAFVVLLGMLISCSADPGELTAEEKYAVDTIYNRKLITWRVELDTLCKQQSDTLFARAIDSLKRERLEEIRLLFNETSSPE
ncbi:MAG: hypothetical protein LW630_03895 [Saprospiraceae bacterium]|jgi:hypothetical protein|nr:hypothetical protein [Saprospiraceae bacterium]